MDNRTQQLLPATLSGFTFYVEKESEPRLGRKKVIHDYPNSGKRNVQDLGPIVGEFEVDAIITGDNYLELRDGFKEVLNREGPQNLVLPSIGAIPVEVLPYSVNYPINKIGVVEFSLRFSISNVNEIPGEAPATVEDVFQAGDEARLEIQDQFEETYQVPSSRKDVLTAISDFKDSVLKTVDTYSTNAIIDNSRLQNIVREVQTNAAALIRDPEQLSKKLIYGKAALVDGLFATFAALFTDPDATDENPKTSANSALDLAEFGSDFKDNGTSASVSDIPLWLSDTANRILRNNNRTLMVETVRLNSLILAFELGANFDYKTSDEINDVIQELENAYRNMIFISDPQGILSNNEAVKSAIDNVKSGAYSVLNQKAQQVFSTTDLSFQGTNSVMNLTYKLYAERFESTPSLEEVAELIADLNLDQNPTRMTGAVVAFES